MRKHLLESLDKIYILDLHGNSKKKEVCPDGSPDQNVFDIMQGVSINIFVKTGKKENEELGEVFNYDLYGKRDFKYLFLEENISKLDWKNLNFEKPNYFFTNKNFAGISNYEKGFKIDELISKYVSGFQTKRDKTTINFSENELLEKKKIFIDFGISEIRNKLQLPEDGRDWTIEWAKKDLLLNNPIVTKIIYRPFDDRFTFYTGKSKGFIAYPRDVMFSHLNKINNLSIISCRQQSTFDFQHIFISRLVSDMCNISSQTKETGYIFPLYLYPETTTQSQQTLAGFETLRGLNGRVPNLNMEIINQFSEKLGIPFVAEKPATQNLQPTTSFAPIDILDYIYSVLHSPSYRSTYKEFLKIDFPRVPYPKDLTTFFDLVALGSQLRQIHLLESEVVEKPITQYPKDGTNVVTKSRFVSSSAFVIPTKEESHQTTSNEESPTKYDASLRQHDKTGRVFINDSQYFANVPEVAWNFYIGGYQPAQKWLKDRKERELSYEDILHYQKIIAALTETNRLMKEIDSIEI